MSNYKLSQLYTLCVGTNVSDPVEARIDGDLITFQIPYDLPYIAVLGLIHGELGTDEKLSRLFYLDDESEYVQVNTQDEYNIALEICRHSRNCLHVVVSGQEYVKKKLPEAEAICAVVSTQCEQLKDSKVEKKEEGNMDSTPHQKDETFENTLLKNDFLTDVIEATPVEFNENIKQLIKQEVSEQVESKIQDILSKIPTSVDIKSDKEEEKEGELTIAQQSLATNDELTLFAILVCENLLGATSKPNIKLQKYWVFRNDGTTAWDERTTLILEHETYDLKGTLYFKSDRHEWGASVKEVQLPTLKQGETGVVEVVHTTPPFRCNYESCWRLSHNGTEFGKIVRCSINVTDEGGTPVDNKSAEKILAENVKQDQIVNQNKSYEQKVGMQQQQEIHTDDISNMLSFNMSDISRMSALLPQPEEPEATSFEVSKSSIHSLSSYKSSNVDGISQATEENEHESLKSNEVRQEESAVDKTSEDDVIDVLAKEEETKATDAEVLEEQIETEEFVVDDDSDALHSVDYHQHTVEEEFHSNDISDFVVVLPECFDMNQPISHEKPKAEGDSITKEKLDESSVSASPEENSLDLPATEEENKKVLSASFDEESNAEATSSEVRAPSIVENQTTATEELPTDQLASHTSVQDERETTFSSNVPHQGSDEETSFPAPTLPVPRPVPRSVLNQDEAYRLPVQNTISIPFEQGWRQQPIVLPASVTDEAGDASDIEEREEEEIATAQDAESDEEETEEFTTPPPSVEPTQIVMPPVEVSPLDQMYEMGFHDIGLNEEMIIRCGGDINRAIQALLMRTLADNSILPLD